MVKTTLNTTLTTTQNRHPGPTRNGNRLSFAQHILRDAYRRPLTHHVTLPRERAPTNTEPSPEHEQRHDRDRHHRVGQSI